MPNQPQEKNWIEFSLVVDQDLAEPITNNLAGLIPGGLVVERDYDGVFPHELDTAIVPVRIYGYLPVDPQLDQIRAEIRAALAQLHLDLSIPEPVYEPLKNQNWATAWQIRYQPIPLGKRMIIVPSWLENPLPERLEIKMDPGMAFGSGTHPTTQLSLILLESCLDTAPVKQMIDVGCGSGILSIAASKLGADQVLGVDNDPEAVLVSAANARLNLVDSSVSFACGSVDEILTGRFKFPQAPLVAANIIAPILTSLFEAGLEKVVSPGGTLVLSGMLEEQLPGMLELLEQNGLAVREKIQEGDWLALRTEKPSS
jgi:ribosomal protein L11 methyltransferase